MQTLIVSNIKIVHFPNFFKNWLSLKFCKDLRLWISLVNKSGKYSTVLSLFSQYEWVMFQNYNITQSPAKVRQSSTQTNIKIWFLKPTDHLSSNDWQLTKFELKLN